MSYATYHELTAPAGDWFAISREFVPNEPDHYVMTRVIGWVIVRDVEEDGSDASVRTQRVEGITAAGYGNVADHIDYFYVCGTDLAPNGQTWAELFNKAPFPEATSYSAVSTHKVISDVVHGWSSES